MKTQVSSYEEPSPNSFSFNSPYGPAQPVKAWARCLQVNMEAVIPDTALSINEGGIAPLG